MKIVECNSIKHDFHKTPNIYPNLSANISNEQQFRLSQINEIKYYFIAEIRERELISKYLSKYITSFEYFIKSLIFLSVLASSISIASFVSVIGAPAALIGASCGISFSIRSGFIKTFLKPQEIKIKNTIKLLC